MKTKERKLKAIYKALDSLWKAKLLIEGARDDLIKFDKPLRDEVSKEYEVTLDTLSESAFKLLRKSENLVKEMDNGS
jgi:hypothetical protein